MLYKSKGTRRKEKELLNTQLRPKDFLNKLYLTWLFSPRPSKEKKRETAKWFFFILSWLKASVANWKQTTSTNLNDFCKSRWSTIEPSQPLSRSRQINIPEPNVVWGNTTCSTRVSVIVSRQSPYTSAMVVWRRLGVRRPIDGGGYVLIISPQTRTNDYVQIWAALSFHRRVV